MRVSAPIALYRGRLGAALLAVASLALGACDALNPIEKACTVTIAPTSIVIAVNERAPVVGTAFDCKGNSIANKTIDFSTANPAVATVSPDGFVIGIAPGQTTVSAVANGKSGTAQVTVTAIMANTVTANPPTITLRKGETRAPFVVTVKDVQGNIITRPLVWSSSNSSVASVDATGSITAVGVGQANIVIQSDQATTSVGVNVTEIPLGRCDIAPTTQRLTVTAQSQPTLTARDTANRPVPLQGRPFNWTSDNEIVAVVSQTGVITARRAGSATIKATAAENANISCTIAVEAADARIVSVVLTPKTGTLRLGIPRGFGYTLADSLGQPIPAGRNVVWSTNTPNIIDVTQLGIVTPKALGTARIIVTAEGVADTVTLPVTQIPVGIIRVTPLQATILEGQSRTYTAVVEDSTGTVVTDRELEWVTNDPTRVRLVPNGRSVTATGIAPGVVSIQATSEGRQSQQSVLVIQQIPVDTIIAPESFAVRVNQTTGFTITLRDAQGNELRNRVVAITSTLPSVATVDATTTTSTVAVRGISVGETTIRLQALNANGQAEGKPSFVRVTVTPPTP